MSRLQLLKSVLPTTFRKAATGDLNNTTKTVGIDVNNSGKYAFQKNDIVTAFNETTYATPDLDPNARMA